MKTVSGVSSGVVLTGGVVFVHAAPAVLCPHVEWAVQAAWESRGVRGVPQAWDWQAQPAEAGSYRTEFPWQGPAGSAAALVSRLVAWERLRFEVTEEAAEGHDGHRWSYTPSLGLFSGMTDSVGNLVVPEDRLKTAVVSEALGGASLHASVDALLGTSWDAELEIFRQAGDGAPLRWLHAVS